MLTELPVRRERSRGAYATVTDVDVIAIRFPFEEEALLSPCAASAQGESDQPTSVLLGRDPALKVDASAMEMIIGEDVLRFASRRAGCCHASHADRVAEVIAERGEAAVHMTGGARCRVRLVSFCGRGFEGPAPSSVHVVRLAAAARFIAGALRRYGPILGGGARRRCEVA